MCDEHLAGMGRVVVVGLVGVDPPGVQLCLAVRGPPCGVGRSPGLGLLPGGGGLLSRQVRKQ